MCSLSGFSESTGNVSSRAMVESRVSEGSPILSEEVSGSEHGGASEQPNVAGMLPSELAENNMPHRCGYEWASTLVTSRFSRYRWSSMVNTYAAVVPMFTTGKTSPELFAERCSPVHNVCHGREAHDHDFFYIFPCMFTNSVIRLPFDEFTMGVTSGISPFGRDVSPSPFSSCFSVFL